MEDEIKIILKLNDVNQNLINILSLVLADSVNFINEHYNQHSSEVKAYILTMIKKAYCGGRNVDYKKFINEAIKHSYQLNNYIDNLSIMMDEYSAKYVFFENFLTNYND